MQLDSLPRSSLSSSWLGALSGGVLRGLLTFINFGWQVNFFLFLLCLPSAVLGALCGALAGNSRTPMRAALWGGVLGGASFAVFVFPVAFIASIFNAASAVERFSFPYLMQRIIVGAVAGAMGVMFGRKRLAEAV